MSKLLHLAPILLLLACGESAKPKRAALGQDSAICATGGMRVYHRPGGPGGEGCVCAWLVGTDAATGLSSLLAIDHRVQTERLVGKAKGSGRDQWNETWDAAGCSNP